LYHLGFNNFNSNKGKIQMNINLEMNPFTINEGQRVLALHAIRDINLLYDGIKSIKQAEENVGGLSVPSKMPTFGWSISAKRCNVGAKLAKNEKSICFRCYALKGRYIFPKVQNALETRYKKWEENRPLFVASMIYLMRHKKGIIESGCFRWFDSGDIQGQEMLDDIIQIAKNTKGIKHWLPTKEYQLIKDNMKRDFYIPDNLVVRVSYPKKGGRFTNTIYKHTSGTLYKNNFESLQTWLDDNNKQWENGILCPSASQGNKCLDCRACWNNEVSTVIYKEH